MVSFIAPHTLTARPLVVAPDDVLYVVNAAGREAVDVVLDGEPVGELASGAEMEVPSTAPWARSRSSPARPSTGASVAEVRSPGSLSSGTLS